VSVDHLLTNQFNVISRGCGQLINKTLDMQFSSDSLRPPPYYFWLICFPIVHKSITPFSSRTYSSFQSAIVNLLLLQSVLRVISSASVRCILRQAHTV